MIRSLLGALWILLMLLAPQTGVLRIATHSHPRRKIAFGSLTSAAPMSRHLGLFVIVSIFCILFGMRV